MYWWAGLVIGAVSFGFGMYVQQFLLIKRPFQLHIRFPNGQAVALGIPTEFWRYMNGNNEPLRMQIGDDGKPPEGMTMVARSPQ